MKNRTAKNYQAGFSAVEGLLVLVIVGLIGVVGWYVYSKSHTSTKPNTAASTPQPAPQMDGEWTVITQKQVSLPAWGLTITFPDKLLGKALYKGVVNERYEFSLRSIIDDPKCLAYFPAPANNPSIGLAKYESGRSATGLFSDPASPTETLQQYYERHKSANGNYFTEASTDQNWYKIGNNFYPLFSSPPAYIQQHTAGFTAACANVDPNWQQDFKDALLSIKAS